MKIDIQVFYVCYAQNILYKKKHNKTIYIFFFFTKIYSEVAENINVIQQHLINVV